MLRVDVAVDDALGQVQAEYERLRTENPDASHRALWLQAEAAAGVKRRPSRAPSTYPQPGAASVVPPSPPLAQPQPHLGFGLTATVVGFLWACVVLYGLSSTHRPRQIRVS